MNASLQGKIALVTGGGSGIGEVIAKRLADEGAKVMILDILDKSVLEECTARHDNISYVIADVRSSSELEKALLKNLPLIVVINKIDRKDARAEEVLNEVYDLLLELSPDERMLEVPVFYANGREGTCGRSLDSINGNLHELLDAIISEIPAPEYDDSEPFQMLVSDLSYSDFLGRLAIGKVMNGSAATNDTLVCVKENSVEQLRVTRIQAYDGPQMVDDPKAEAGDIIVLAGVGDVSIGDTICTKEEVKALPRIEVALSSFAIGHNTSDAILSGVLRGSAAMIDGLIEQCEKELGGKAVIVATGGYSGLVANYLKRHFDFINPTLTLEGLRYLYQINKLDVVSELEKVPH